MLVNVTNLLGTISCYFWTTLVESSSVSGKRCAVWLGDNFFSPFC